MDSITKAKLKRLVQNSDWEVIYSFQAYVEHKWKEQPLIGSTEFETIKNAISQESKTNGLREFFETIEKIALD